MHITMVKKTLADGSDCRKCAEATDHLQSKGLWDRIDEVVWVRENEPGGPGMALASRLGVDRAPFFVVKHDSGTEEVYVSVLQLVRDRLGDASTPVDRVAALAAIDPDDIGGI